ALQLHRFPGQLDAGESLIVASEIRSFSHASGPLRFYKDDVQGSVGLAALETARPLRVVRCRIEDPRVAKEDFDNVRGAVMEILPEDPEFSRGVDVPIANRTVATSRTR